MQQPPQWTLASMLWLVAFASLPLAAAASPTEGRGLEGMALSGFAIWVIACLRECMCHRSPAGRASVGEIDGVKPPFAELCTVATIEGLGMAGALGHGDESLASYFALSLSFALAGITNARRRAPSADMVFCQLVFHGLVAIPGLVFEGSLAVGQFYGQRLYAYLGNAGGMMAVMVLTAVTVPPLFMILISTAAVELARPDDDRDLPGSALLSQEAACLLLFMRWVFGLH